MAALGPRGHTAAAQRLAAVAPGSDSPHAPAPHRHSRRLVHVGGPPAAAGTEGPSTSSPRTRPSGTATADRGPVGWPPRIWRPGGRHVRRPEGRSRLGQSHRRRSAAQRAGRQDSLGVAARGRRRAAIGEAGAAGRGQHGTCHDASRLIVPYFRKRRFTGTATNGFSESRS
jgi:hypothetical protein